MKWNVFLTAVLVAWIFLLWSGAPPAPVLLGTGLLALWSWRRAARRIGR
jgi:uncharacterized membrane protein